MLWPFVVHQTYHRRRDIHDPFGGQQQGGISTPAAAPGVFIFTGHGGHGIGYSDRFHDDGSLRYTGQGQKGPMQMISGNRAIRDHAASGKDLLVFTQQAKGGRVRFEGLFACAGWDIETQSDIDGSPRPAIVFHLVPQPELDSEAAGLETELPPAAPLADLKARAIAAASFTPSTSTAPPRTVYERSRDVRDYVLARADGVCEGCDQPAPFVTKFGRPYLEAHHIRRLSDGGPDDIRYVAGICPNCHRRAHFGSDREAFNATLTATVLAKE